MTTFLIILAKTIGKYERKFARHLGVNSICNASRRRSVPSASGNATGAGRAANGARNAANGARSAPNGGRSALSALSAREEG